MIRILIVEDEPLIAKDLEYAVQDLGYSVSASCRNSRQALEALQREVPDLIICDIHLHNDDWDGICLAQEIRLRYDIPLIFLTALSDAETIRRAAQTQPQAYLTKPFDERTLYAAIELAIIRFASPEQASASPAEAPPPFIAGSFFVKDKKRLVKIKAEDIQWIKADGAYSLLAANQQQYLLSVHLGAIESSLGAFSFARVHRSYLVNVQHIEAIEDDLIFIGKERIPIGKSFREDFYSRIRQF